MQDVKLVRIGATDVEFHGDGLTVSRLPGGAEVHARPHETEEYRARAVALGYGTDIARMSREHEVLHHLLALWLGLPESPTLRGVASGEHWQHWQVEEAAVLALQRMAQVVGVDVVTVASEG